MPMMMPRHLVGTSSAAALNATALPAVLIPRNTEAAMTARTYQRKPMSCAKILGHTLSERMSGSTQDTRDDRGYRRDDHEPPSAQQVGERSG